MTKYFLLLFLFLTLNSSAQKGKFSAGMIVLANGDTLGGFVNWKKNAGSKDSLYFKNLESGEAVAYSWSSVRFIHTDKGAERLVCTVKRTLEYIDPFTFNIMLPDSTVTEAIPLTPVCKGVHVSLYKFSGDSEYFFIYDGDRMVQLVQTYRYLTITEKMHYLNPVPRYFINSVYKTQLLEYYDFDADPKMANLLEISTYDEQSLRKLLVKMDGRIK
ncbi:MAG: hypothetical protein HZA79_09845 [Sphingobacteriales bacterium]|nr:hypothetical protein [Sphingobacteriales bacterium]